MQPLAILFGAGFTVAACLGCGAVALGPAVRDAAIRFVAGSAILSMIVFALCCLGWAYPAVFLGVGALAIAAGWRWLPALGKIEILRQRRILALPFLLFLVLYFFNAMAPEVSPDGSGYHLGFVGQFLRWHGFHPITWSIYAVQSQGVEMLFLFAYAFGKHSAAAMVHFAFLLALAWEMLSYSRRAGYPKAGACAALLVFASPVVGVDGTSAYNDVAVAAIGFTLFYLLRTWDEERTTRLLPVIGLVAGFGFGVKYTAWIAVPYALAVVAWKSRRFRDLAIVAAPAALMVVPWLVRNWLWVQNPVAPFFNNIFRNQYISYYFEEEYKRYLALYDLHSRWEIPVQAAAKGGLVGILGPIFLLAPIALLALRHAEGRRLLLAALVFGGNYFTNIGTRFLIPPLPFVALALMLVLDRIPGAAITVALVHAVLSWPPVIPRYSSPNPWRLAKLPYREALRLRPQEEYLRSHLMHYGLEKLVDATPPGSLIFSFGAIPEAYTSRRVLVGWESTPNTISGLILQSANEPQMLPTWRVRFTFPRRPMTAIRLVQTAEGGQPWKIHELRIFDGARELPRDSQWRLTASPYPWGIQDAFDNSPSTMWWAGEMLRPGEYVEIDFHRREEADGALMESAPDVPQLRLRLESRDDSGRWTLLSDTPQIYDAPAPLGLRRAAMRELKQRGIDYLIAFEGEEQTEDLRRHPQLWGVREVGRDKDARLFQLP